MLGFRNNIESSKSIYGPACKSKLCFLFVPMIIENNYNAQYDKETRFLKTIWHIFILMILIFNMNGPYNKC